MLTSLSIALLSGGALAVDAPPVPQEEPVVAIRAAHLRGSDGAVVDDVVVLLEGGVVRAIGADVAVPDHAAVVEHDGFVSAGLVAAASRLLPNDERHESTRPFLPELALADAFDPSQLAYADALAQGVTAAVLTPSPRNVVGGRTAVVKTTGGTVLSDSAHLAVSMSQQAADRMRYPTSFAGIVHELREKFTEPEGRYAEVGDGASGQLGLLVAASQRDEISRALSLFGELGVVGTLVGPSRTDELAAAIADSGFSVVLSPLRPGANRNAVESPAELAEAGVPFAFELVAPDDLRFSAAMAVRHGADPAAAWRAITSDAARIARVDDRVGSLEAGRDADLVLWSGDPLDLSSRVEAVYVDGARVQ